MSKLNNQIDEDLVKSLSDELDMPVEEITSLLEKSEETDESEEGVEKEKDGESEVGDDDGDEKKEKVKKSETEDLTKLPTEELMKSVGLIIGELKSRKPVESPIEKSNDNDLFKSMEDNILKSFGESVKKLTDDVDTKIEGISETISEIKKSIDLIGEASQGTKAINFDYLQKAGDDSPVEEEGKIYVSPSDRDFISEKLLGLIEKATDEDIKKSLSTDLINYQGSGEITKSMVSNLNRNDIYFKTQRK